MLTQTNKNVHDFCGIPNDPKATDKRSNRKGRDYEFPLTFFRLFGPPISPFSEQLLCHVNAPSFGRTLSSPSTDDVLAAIGEFITPLRLRKTGVDIPMLSGVDWRVRKRAEREKKCDWKREN